MRSVENRCGSLKGFYPVCTILDTRTAVAFRKYVDLSLLMRLLSESRRAACHYFPIRPLES